MLRVEHVLDVPVNSLFAVEAPGSHPGFDQLQVAPRRVILLQVVFGGADDIRAREAAHSRELAAQLVRLASAPGARASVINVWATWCGPCREEFPALLAVAKRHPDVRLVLVSADFETQAPQARAFLAAHGVRDTTYLKHESDQAFIDGLAPDWSGALPATIVYDARGRRVAFWEGAADSTRFEAAIAAAFRPSSNQEAPR